MKSTPERRTQHADLMTEGQVLKGQVRSACDDGTGDSEEASKDRELGHLRSSRPAENLKDVRA